MSDPDAGRTPSDPPDLAFLDAQIRVLVAQVAAARDAYELADWRLSLAREQRDQLARRATVTPVVLAPVSPGPTAPFGPAAAARYAPPDPPPAEAPTGPEASTRTVQNALFILGGLLLGTAAIVFTAVAWAAYGVGGRAAILAGLTVLALAAPLVALRRRLTATAETFAGVGLLLVALDGYAAWYVNLFGVAGGSGPRYAGVVALVTAAAAAGYGRLTGLVGPRLVAALAIQPVVPLLAVPLHPDPAGWSLVAAGVAGLNLVLIAIRRRGPAATAVRGVGWAGYVLALVAAGVNGGIAETRAGTAVAAALAGLSVIAFAAVAVAGAQLSRRDDARTGAAALAVLASCVAGSVFATVAWPDHALVGVAGVVFAVSVIGSAIGRALTRDLAPARPDADPADPVAADLAVVAVSPVGSPTHRGTAAGTVIAVTLFGVALVRLTVLIAGQTLQRALPPWHADLVTTARYDWQLLAAIGLVAVAGWVVLRRAEFFSAAAVLTVLALPGSVALPWWAPSALDLAAAAVLVVVAVLPGLVRRGTAPATAAGLLAAYAVLAGLGRPAGTAATLGGLVVIGLATAALARVPGARRPVAGWSLSVGLATIPPAVAATLVAATRAGVLAVPSWWVARLTVAAVAVVLLVLVAVGRWLPALTGYGYGALLACAALWPAVAVALTAGEPAGIYGGVSLLLIAAALVPAGSTVDRVAGGRTAALPAGSTVDRTPGGRTAALVPAAAVAALPGAILLASGVVPVLVAVFGGPFGWLDAIWTGAPTGSGLAPTAPLARTGLLGQAATGPAAWSLGLLALASATATYAVTRRLPAALGALGLGGPTAIILAAVAAGLPWPGVPGTMLAVGLGLLAAVGIAPAGRLRTAVATTQGLLYVAAGLAGCLALKWSTIAGLLSIVVVAAVVGGIGRSSAWRVAGWLGGVAAAVGLAVASGRAADLALPATAPLVLAVAFAALVLDAALQRLRPIESRAVAAAAHTAAVVALLLADGWTAHAATLSSVWGVAVGLRALWPGTSRSGRAIIAAGGAAWELLAWWLLLAARNVSLVEAYTAPLAAVALVAGWAALRARPDLRSWVSYGPALGAAFLPSLALVLSDGDSPWRRLLLGAAALVVVFAGAVRRRQAPVVAGGAILTILALHEIPRAWDLLPRWIPLALGGLLLVGLAITYERRRRDLARLRAAVGRMT